MLLNKTGSIFAFSIMIIKIGEQHDEKRKLHEDDPWQRKRLVLVWFNCCSPNLIHKFELCPNQDLTLILNLF